MTVKTFSQFTMILIMIVIFVPSNFAGGFFGAKLGVSTTFNDIEKKDYQQYENVDEIEPSQNFNVGIFGTLYFNESMGIQVDCHWTQKKQEIESYYFDYEQSGNDMTKMELKTTYLTIPIQLRFEVPKLSIKPYLLAGPRFDILLSENLRIDDESKKELQSQAEEVYLKPGDFITGIDIAVGLQLEIIPLKPFLEIRYQHDLQKIYDTELIDMKNKIIQVMVGISL